VRPSPAQPDRPTDIHVSGTPPTPAMPRNYFPHLFVIGLTDAIICLVALKLF
jgi:hypothetical protein